MCVCVCVRETELLLSACVAASAFSSVSVLHHLSTFLVCFFCEFLRIINRKIAQLSAYLCRVSADLFVAGVAASGLRYFSMFLYEFIVQPVCLCVSVTSFHDVNGSFIILFPDMGLGC